MVPQYVGKGLAFRRDVTNFDAWPDGQIPQSDPALTVVGVGTAVAAAACLSRGRWRHRVGTSGSIPAQELLMIWAGGSNNAILPAMMTAVGRLHILQIAGRSGVRQP